MIGPGYHLDAIELGERSDSARAGSRWTTIGFISVEAVTLAISVLCYLAMRHYLGRWSNAPLPLPDPGPAVAQSILMLASLYPMTRLARAADRFDLRSTRRWLVVGVLFGLGFLVLRGFELDALNVRWDAGAFAAITWLTVGFHTVVLVLEVVETGWLAVAGRRQPLTERQYTEARGKPVYWYFMTGSWILVAGILYLAPRLS